MQSQTVCILLMIFLASTYSSVIQRVINPFEYQGKPKKGSLVVDCFDHITREMAETYESFIVYSDTPEMCLIFLPENVEVNFVELNFTNPSTYTRVLAGAAKKTVTYRYSPVYATNTTEDYGIFNVQCPFGLVAFRPADRFWEESVEFALNVTYGFVDWSITCPEISRADLREGKIEQEPESPPNLPA